MRYESNYIHMDERGERLSSIGVKSSRSKYTPNYTFDFDPHEFEGYIPSDTSHLSKKDIAALSEHIKNVCNLDDENALILLLRFGFGIKCSDIRQLIGTSKKIQGICEAFRFSCQRYLSIAEAISDKSMWLAFKLAMQDYEILFLHKNKGIRWMRQANIQLDNGVTTLRDALLYERCKNFIQLDTEPPSLWNTVTLDYNKTKRLAKYIQDLPVEFGSILMLHYYQRLEPKVIESQCDTKYAKGKIEYFRRLFTQRLGLEFPISDKSFSEACSIIVDELSLT